MGSKIKYSILSFFIIYMLFLPCPKAQETVSTLFEDSYTFFQLLRQENGIYRDALRFEGNHFHPASIAATGMGLVSLCIAGKMGWISDAEELAETTLKTVTGHTPGFNPDRNASGYFRHWVDLKTGSRAWNSEYSSIDTAILACGANFCRNYFHSARINTVAEELFDSIDWSKAIANPETGSLYREFDASGNGILNATTTPYSEYILVAWLAMKEEQKQNPNGPATILWNTWYASPNQIKTSEYNGLALLTDQPGHYQSHFTLLFPYYLCHEFALSPEYKQFMDHARQADQHWFAQQEGRNTWEWGLGAGSVGYGSGYHADAINANPGAYYSPQIIAGFLPVYPAGINDLETLLQKEQGLYSLPDISAKVLWRKSIEDREWRVADIQGVDYATLLFGLATLPQHCGVDFFETYNAIANQKSSTQINEQY